jgi:hypothetical protein
MKSNGQLNVRFPGMLPVSSEWDTESLDHTAETTEAHHPPGRFKSEKFRDTVFWGSTADGVIAGGHLAEAVVQIDPHVIDAVQFSTVQELHSLPDIHNYVDSHFFDMPAVSADGWFNRLTGYVAEQRAAEYFEQIGHEVQFAPVPNQPDWDMLVDGHPVQIKENLAQVKEFVVDHPDIDVFTSQDIAASIKDPAVHGLDVLDKDAIHAATQGTLDGLDGTFGLDIDFPVITFLLSSWREAKLLRRNKTTFIRASKNVAFDVGGVATGAAVGGQIGATLGSFLPGPGTLLGGVAGLISGAIFGKFIATTIRKAPFNAAREAYNEAVETAQATISQEVDRSKERLRDLQVGFEEQFQRERNAIETESTTKIALIKNAFQADCLVFTKAFQGFYLSWNISLMGKSTTFWNVCVGPAFWAWCFHLGLTCIAARLRGGSDGPMDYWRTRKRNLKVSSLAI